ncbi:MAG: non-heme iron oxygenase ferredoxin subunit [Candidatus Thiodiazotropha sp. 6PLUC1]
MQEQWIKVAAADELPPGKMKRFDFEQHRYLIVNAEGQIYAVNDQCSHEDVSLYLGCIQGQNIKCSLHGSRFCLKTGLPLEEPATEAIATFPVKIENNQILIQLKK